MTLTGSSIPFKRRHRRRIKVDSRNVVDVPMVALEKRLDFVFSFQKFHCTASKIGCGLL